MFKKEDPYSLNFLDKLSFKLKCPKCGKSIYTTDEKKLYELLAEHLEDCKVKPKLK